MLLEGGLDWKSMSLSPRDMDFLEAKHAAAREIALALGVPPMLLGIPGDNTFSNYQEATRTFWRQTVLPLVQRTAKALTTWLSEPLVLKPDMDTVDALTGDRDALWQRLQSTDFLTDDEKRAQIGYGPKGAPDSLALKAGFRLDQPRDDGGRWSGGGGGDDGSETPQPAARRPAGGGKTPPPAEPPAKPGSSIRKGFGEVIPRAGAGGSPLAKRIDLKTSGINKRTRNPADAGLSHEWKHARMPQRQQTSPPPSPAPAPEIKRAQQPLAPAQVAPDGTFSGYASLFDVPDLGGDIVSRGAFRRSLAKRGAAGIRLLFQHDPAQPLGVWLNLTEDTLGLLAQGRLDPNVTRAREVLSLMRSGALDGLSIGFRTVKGSRDPTTGLRRLDEIDLWEISIVTFPMQPDARVTAVKARGGATPIVRGAAEDVNRQWQTKQQRRLLTRLRRATRDLQSSPSPRSPSG